MIWIWLGITYVICLNFNIVCFRRANKSQDNKHEKIETHVVLIWSLVPFINYVCSVIIIFTLISESDIYNNFSKWIQGE